METSAIFFALAAVGGALLAAIRISGTPRPPTWVALVHGTLGAIGLVLLGSAAATSGGLPQMGLIALGILVLAALGGATIFLGWHLRGRSLPIPLVLGHGAIAATGFIVLLLAIYRP